MTHRQISQQCLSWLYNRVSNSRIRGNTEVILDTKYGVDAFALCYLRPESYKEYCIDDFSGDEIACVFEVKVTRNDFLKTFNKTIPSNRINTIGNLNWCVVKKGIANPDEVYDSWGFIEVDHGVFNEIKKPLLSNVYQFFNVVPELYAHSLLWSGQRKWDKLICPDCGKK